MPRKRKPFVPVEIEFIQLISRYISAKTGMPKREVIGAAAEMWNECISAGKTEIHPLILCMYFPPETHEALIEFELISRTENGFLVRGIVKHLDAIKAKKEGANITNAKKTEAVQERGAKRTCGQSGNTKGTEAEHERYAKRGAKRTENDERGAKRTAYVPQKTEDRIHNTEDINTKNHGSTKNEDSKNAESANAQSAVSKDLKTKLLGLFKAYTGVDYPPLDAKENTHLKRLVAMAQSEAQILELWQFGLQSKYPSVATFAQLSMHWATLIKNHASAGATNPVKREIIFSTTDAAGVNSGDWRPESVCFVLGKLKECFLIRESEGFFEPGDAIPALLPGYQISGNQIPKRFKTPEAWK